VERVRCTTTEDSTFKRLRRAFVEEKIKEEESNSTAEQLMIPVSKKRKDLEDLNPRF